MPAEAAWVLRLWAVVALFAGVTVLRSHQVGIPLRDPHGAVLTSRVALSLGLFVALVIADAGVRSRRRHRTLRMVPTVMRERWPARRVVLALTGLLAYHVVYFCYHNLKSWDVFNQPRDRELLRWDQCDEESQRERDTGGEHGAVGIT